MAHDTELRDVPPSEALQMYLAQKKQDCSKNTVNSHASRLSFFTEWCDTEGIEHLHELDGYDLQRYRLDRFGGDDDYSDYTIKGQLHTLRVFIRYCESIEAVEQGLSEKVQVPGEVAGTSQRGKVIEHDRAIQILQYLDKYEYATQTHVCCHLMWYCAIRVGTVHSIDVGDLDLDEGQIRIRHRPSEDTRLKNGTEAERVISIRPETVSLLSDYIDTHRDEVKDEHGRRPLVTTKHGRAARKTIRNWSYGATRPCLLSGDCPHDTTPEECDAARNVNKAHACPDAESTHAWRRGSISWHLREGTSKTVVGDRANVSTGVLEKHYSTLSEEEKAEVRREKFPEG